MLATNFERITVDPNQMGVPCVRVSVSRAPDACGRHYGDGSAATDRRSSLHQRIMVSGRLTWIPRIAKITHDAYTPPVPLRRPCQSAPIVALRLENAEAGHVLGFLGERRSEIL
jgi:hypothetical protein